MRSLELLVPFMQFIPLNFISGGNLDLILLEQRIQVIDFLLRIEQTDSFRFHLLDIDNKVRKLPQMSGLLVENLHVLTILVEDRMAPLLGDNL